jgi:hypothetical protein
VIVPSGLWRARGRRTDEAVTWPCLNRDPEAMSTGTIFLHKNMETYLSRPKKRYLWRSGWRSTVHGLRHTWTLKKKHSFTHSFFPAAQLLPLRVGCLVGCCVGCCVVVMLLLLSLFTLLPHCNTAATATVGMPPPPPPPSVGVEVDACYMNANSSPAMLAQAVCRAPTEGWWQQRGRGGGDRALDYNEGVGCYPIVWGVEGARGERDLIVLGRSSWDKNIV